MKKVVSILTLVCILTSLPGQEKMVQTIYGNVTDAVTGYTLVGANIILLDSDPVNGTTTDINGNFTLENVPLGRQSLEIRYIGYKTQIVPNLYVNSGKEVSIRISLEEDLVDMEEVVVKYSRRKDIAQNDMAIVSSRTFSVEETERFAGSLGDPARMVANYAGVMTQNDSRNDIIIRGNSPIGVSWRLEDIEIPNPNHFGALGTTGGPVSMINNNLLANSDFLTGAFPAEYGNATSGVFDLNMRSGNRENFEFTGQIGFNGFEIGVEGPFATVGKTQKATYLANFRYSTLQLLNEIGFGVGTGEAVPEYKDLTFLVDLPGTRLGRWKLIGLWGNSFISMGRTMSDTVGTSYNSVGTATDFGSSLGVIGIKNTYFFNENTRINTSLSYQRTGATTVLDSVRYQDASFDPFVRNYENENKLSLSTELTQKINAKNNYRIGIIMDRYDISYIDSINHPVYNKFITTTDVEGSMGMIRGFAQWSHAVNSDLTLLGGINTQYFSLNHEISVEPRAALNWSPWINSSFSLGYGLHSQIQPKSVYFIQTYDSISNSYSTTNEDLGSTKSHHFVLGFDHRFSKNLRFKAETYYQHLFNVPVSGSMGAYSILNAGDFFGISALDSLENKGTGRNYGVEFTMEKFLDKGYYILLTASLFDSKYVGGDGIMRNTAFNGNYVINLLSGYERKVGKKSYFTADLKTVWAGGRRYVPIDLESSVKEGVEIRDWDHAYENRYNDYLRLDLRLGFKVNKRRFSQEWAIDLQNVTNYKSIFMEGFDPGTGEIYKVYQQGFMPMFLYRIQF